MTWKYDKCEMSYNYSMKSERAVIYRNIFYIYFQSQLKHTETRKLNYLLDVLRLNYYSLSHS